MNNKYDQRTERHISTDELINDYLNDILGPSDVSAIKSATFKSELYNRSHSSVADVLNDKPTQSQHQHLKTSSIQDGLHITLTINPFNSGSTKLRSPNEAIIILLTNLYFLRRPLSPRVRQSFLILSEQVIDDYQASQWIENTQIVEVLSEV